MAHYFLELNKPPARLEVFQFDDEDLEALMDEHDVDTPAGLNDPGDFHVFDTEEKADKFLARFLFETRGLERRSPYPTSPHMLLKRRYMALVRMGIKTVTFRSYEKPWRPDQIFVFHDQTYYVACRLTKPITETDDGFRYEFELVK